MAVTTEGLVALFTNMEFDTLGSAKLEFLGGRLGVDELVEKVGLVITDTDGEEIVNKAQGRYGDQVLVMVEVLALLQTLLPHGVDL